MSFCLGLSLILAIKKASFLSDTSPSGKFLGMYCLMSLFAFSIAPFLPRGVWGSKKDGNLDLLGDEQVVGEFRTVISGDGLKSVPHVRQQEPSCGLRKRFCVFHRQGGSLQG